MTQSRQLKTRRRSCFHQTQSRFCSSVNRSLQAAVTLELRSVVQVSGGNALVQEERGERPFSSIFELIWIGLVESLFVFPPSLLAEAHAKAAVGAAAMAWAVAGPGVARGQCVAGRSTSRGGGHDAVGLHV